MLIDVVKAEAAAAMVDGGLRSGVNGVGGTAQRVARMSAAICGISIKQESRMSLRSSGLRLLIRLHLPHIAATGRT